MTVQNGAPHIEAAPFEANRFPTRTKKPDTGTLRIFSSSTPGSNDARSRTY